MLEVKTVNDNEKRKIVEVVDTDSGKYSYFWIDSFGLMAEVSALQQEETLLKLNRSELMQLFPDTTINLSQRRMYNGKESRIELIRPPAAGPGGGPRYPLVDGDGPFVDARGHIFQRVLLYKKPALFTTARVWGCTVPNGLHSYLTFGKRGAENTPSRIAKGNVIEHFTGSLITAMEVPFPEGKASKILGETSLMETMAGRHLQPRDTPRLCTLRQFMESQYKDYPERIERMRPAMRQERPLLFTGNREMDQETGCIVHLRVSFDNSEGTRYHGRWEEHIKSHDNEDFQQTVEDVRQELRSAGPLRSRRDMEQWNRLNPEGNMGDDGYGYVIEEGDYSFYLRCKPSFGDHEAYLYIYNREMAMTYLANHQEAPPTAPVEEPQTEPGEKPQVASGEEPQTGPGMEL